MATKKATATKRVRTGKAMNEETTKSSVKPLIKGFMFGDPTKSPTQHQKDLRKADPTKGVDVAGLNKLAKKLGADIKAGRVAKGQPAIKSPKPKAVTKNERVKRVADVPFEGGEPAKPNPPAKKGKLPKLKIPKSLGACADLLKKMETSRLTEAKRLKEMQAQETALRNHIIDTLPKSQLGGATGKLYRAEIKKKEVPQVQDWDKLQKYIKKTGSFDLLGRSINAKAVAERWENKKQIPGVTKFEAVSLSITKV